MEHLSQGQEGIKGLKGNAWLYQGIRPHRECSKGPAAFHVYILHINTHIQGTRVRTLYYVQCRLKVYDTADFIRNVYR